MTKQEALREARRRWGKTSSTYDRHNPKHEVSRQAMLSASSRVGRFWVGSSKDGVPVANFVYGNGDSWEAAFLDADRRQKEGAQ